MVLKSGQTYLWFWRTHSWQKSPELIYISSIMRRLCRIRSWMRWRLIFGVRHVQFQTSVAFLTAVSNRLKAASHHLRSSNQPKLNSTCLVWFKDIKYEKSKLSKKCIKQLICTQAKCKDDEIQGSAFFYSEWKAKILISCWCFVQNSKIRRHL